MGALISIPLLFGGLGTLGSSLCSGCMIFMGEYSIGPMAMRAEGYSHPGGTAASAFCKSCNCNSSIATRVGFGVSFRLATER